MTQTAEQQIHVYLIGSDGTEYYAASSEQQMRDWYAKTVGDDSVEEDLREHFEEVTEIDAKFPFNDDGEMRETSWRELAQEMRQAGHWPCQLSTGYN